MLHVLVTSRECVLFRDLPFSGFYCMPTSLVDVRSHHQVWLIYCLSTTLHLGVISLANFHHFCWARSNGSPQFLLGCHLCLCLLLFAWFQCILVTSVSICYVSSETNLNREMFSLPCNVFAFLNQCFVPLFLLNLHSISAALMSNYKFN